MTFETGGIAFTEPMVCDVISMNCLQDFACIVGRGQARNGSDGARTQHDTPGSTGGSSKGGRVCGQAETRQKRGMKALTFVLCLSLKNYSEL